MIKIEDLINLAILLGFALSMAILFEKRKKKYFIVGIVLDLAAVVFILFHLKWWGEMLGAANILNWFTQQHMSIWLIIQGTLTWLATVTLFLSPMCSPVADDWVEKKGLIK